MGDDIALLSDRALYLYDGRDLDSSDGLLSPRQRVPLPGRAADLERVDMMELFDGWLVSFTFARWSSSSEAGIPFQAMVRVFEDGRSETVARRAIARDYSEAFRYRDWVPSPVLYSVHHAAMLAFSGNMRPMPMATPPVPRAMQAIAGVLLLLAAAGAWWRTRRTDLSTPARIAWVVACGVVGLPALLTLWLMYPERETVADDDAVVAQPAMA